MAYVYVLRNGNTNVFKIGRTDPGVEVRRKQLATGNPLRLTRFDVIETQHESVCETYLHRTLRSKKCPAAGGQEFYELTPEELRSVISDAREFLAEFIVKQEEAKRLAEEESDGVLLKPGDAEWSVYYRLVAAREEEDKAKYLRQHLENELKIAIGRADGLDGIATWRTQLIERLDQEALKTAEPDVFQRYARTLRVRYFRLT